MSKIKEKNSSAKLRSAEKAKDRKFEQWVQQQFMAEAAAIEKEIDEIPDSEEFEPTEEKFQKLLQRAKEQGSVHSESDSTQTKVSEDRAKEKNGIITSEKIKSEKLNNEKLNKEPNETNHKRSKRKFARDAKKEILLSHYEFDKWVRQQFLEEAEDIEKEIEQIPDSKAWEPTEEKFQELLQKAKKQGTIQSPTGFIQKTGSEEDRDKKNRKTYPPGTSYRKQRKRSEIYRIQLG